MSAAEEARPVTLADFLERAATRLCADPPGPGDPLSNPRGDHSLDPDGGGIAPAVPHRRAAVLVPVLAREDGVSLLMTTRAAHLRDHSGQIAFPGGKIEGAESPVEAALREAGEEIGLEAQHVRVLGHLDPYLSGTGFLVVPVVGLVTPDAVLRLNPDEVADAFEVPLGFLADPSAYEIQARFLGGRTRHFYAIPYRNRMIWGVTAGIVHNLFERLFA